jgi:hypothetical protein
MIGNGAIIRIIMLSAIILNIPLCWTAAWAWGPEGHTLITKNAVQLLPKEMRGFYDANIAYLNAFSMLPDDWRQTHRNETYSQHFIDLDMYDQPPFSKIRTDRATAEKRFGKDEVLSAGTVPWVIEERYGKLIKAFRAQDMEEVVLESALLAHYIADSHVPFHTTKYFDGKSPEQKGLHFRWESNMVIMCIKPERIKPAVPAKVDDILKSAFDWCVDSYSYADTICAAEDAARAEDPTHAFTYYKILWEKTGDIAEGRLSKAAEDLAGTWISAWRTADSPKLENNAAPLYWGR